MSENNSTSKSYLGFSQNNFYYINAQDRGIQYAPDVSCSEVFNNTGVFNDLKCNHSTFKDNSFNCLKKVMCENKKLAESLTIQYNNRGSDVKYSDNKTSYNIYLIKIANLLIGISAILYFIYKDNNSNNNSISKII